MSALPAPVGAVVLVCPVRACGRPLLPEGRALCCGAGHRFDRARSGYVNLLLAHERRSASPGDAAEVGRARRRLWESGLDAPLLAALLEELRAERPAGAILDAGCGEGSMLAALAAELRLEAHGADISAASIDLAARAHPSVRFVVANADRRLPYGDGSFAVALRINAHASLGELRRTVAPGGRLVLVVPGPDDLAEIREAISGRALPKERGLALESRLPPSLRSEGSRRLAWRVPLSRETLDDLLLCAYRGARRRERARIEEAPPSTVTRSQDVLWLRAVETGGPA